MYNLDFYIHKFLVTEILLKVVLSIITLTALVQW